MYGANMTNLGVVVTDDVKRRLQRAAKRLGRSMSRIAGDWISEGLERTEAKFREEDARREASATARRGRNTASGGARVTRLGSSPLAPLRKELAPRNLQLPEDEDAPQDQTLYEAAGGTVLATAYLRQAKKIALAAHADVVERRLVLAEAIAAIKHEAPLTHPGDTEIIRTLERTVLAVRQKLVQEGKLPVPADTAAAATMHDGVEPRSVDPTKLRFTGGDPL